MKPSQLNAVRKSIPDRYDESVIYLLSFVLGRFHVFAVFLL